MAINYIVRGLIFIGLLGIERHNHDYNEKSFDIPYDIIPLAIKIIVEQWLVSTNKCMLIGKGVVGFNIVRGDVINGL